MFKTVNIAVFVMILASLSSAQLSFLPVQPLCNEISLYQNFLDDGDDAGQTLQLVLINSVNVLTGFNIEFTADFNRRMTPGKDNDYYMEIGIVKPFWKKTSINYQRIYGTFIDKPINQIGLRYSF